MDVSRIEQEAASWYVARDGGSFTVEDLDEFHRWLAADPRHREIFNRIRAANDLVSEQIRALVRRYGAKYVSEYFERRACARKVSLE
jgi:ferric-dicitrate binding protein FerR (iron transport regulator)